MAGDWISVRTDLRYDPAIISICENLEMSEGDVIGAIVLVWSWAQKYAHNGKVQVSLDYIDRCSGIDDFGQQMINAGFLEIEEDGALAFHISRSNRCEE